MQIKQLEYIIKIAECGSITQAAEQLFVSQPGLTKSIMQLEEEYGIRIFLRKARGISLTEEGKDFLYYAKSVVAATSSLDKAFAKDTPTEFQKSKLSLASQQLAFLYDVLLQTYQQIHTSQDFHFNVVEADRSGVTRSILNGDVDLGIMVRSTADSKGSPWYKEFKRLEIHVLDRAGVFLCMGPSCPYYERESISFEEAERCTHAALDMEDAAKETLYLHQGHFNTNRVVFFNTVSACSHFLLHSDAVLYTAKWTAECFQGSGLKIIPVLPAGDGGDFPTNELLWFKRAGEPLTRTELRFINNLYGYFQLPVPEQYRLPISRVERSIYPPFPFAADQKIMSDERAGAEARPYETPGIKK